MTEQPTLIEFPDPTQRMRDRAGRADPATLPHSCKCGARWAGSRTAHCAGSCHLTYSGVSTFDKHRQNGRCVEPAALGMSLIPGRAYQCWGHPADVEAAA